MEDLFCPVVALEQAELDDEQLAHAHHLDQQGVELGRVDELAGRHVCDDRESLLVGAGLPAGFGVGAERNVVHFAAGLALQLRRDVFLDLAHFLEDVEGELRRVVQQRLQHQATDDGLVLAAQHDLAVLDRSDEQLVVLRDDHGQPLRAVEEHAVARDEACGDFGDRDYTADVCECVGDELAPLEAGGFDTELESVFPEHDVLVDELAVAHDHHFALILVDFQLADCLVLQQSLHARHPQRRQLLQVEHLFHPCQHRRLIHHLSQALHSTHVVDVQVALDQHLHAVDEVLRFVLVADQVVGHEYGVQLRYLVLPVVLAERRLALAEVRGAAAVRVPVQREHVRLLLVVHAVDQGLQRVVVLLHALLAGVRVDLGQLFGHADHFLGDARHRLGPLFPETRDQGDPHVRLDEGLPVHESVLHEQPQRVHVGGLFDAFAEHVVVRQAFEVLDDYGFVVGVLVLLDDEVREGVGVDLFETHEPVAEVLHAFLDDLVQARDVVHVVDQLEVLAHALGADFVVLADVGEAVDGLPALGLLLHHVLDERALLPEVLGVAAVVVEYGDDEVLDVFAHVFRRYAAVVRLGVAELRDRLVEDLHVVQVDRGPQRDVLLDHASVAVEGLDVCGVVHGFGVLADQQGLLLLEAALVLEHFADEELVVEVVRGGLEVEFGVREVAVGFSDVGRDALAHDDAVEAVVHERVLDVERERLLELADEQLELVDGAVVDDLLVQMVDHFYVGVLLRPVLVGPERRAQAREDVVVEHVAVLYRGPEHVQSLLHAAVLHDRLELLHLRDLTGADIGGDRLPRGRFGCALVDFRECFFVVDDGFIEDVDGVFSVTFSEGVAPAVAVCGGGVPGAVEFAVVDEVRGVSFFGGVLEGVFDGEVAEVFDGFVVVHEVADEGAPALYREPHTNRVVDEREDADQVVARDRGQRRVGGLEQLLADGRQLFLARVQPGLGVDLFLPPLAVDLEALFVELEAVREERVECGGDPRVDHDLSEAVCGPLAGEDVLVGGGHVLDADDVADVDVVELVEVVLVRVVLVFHFEAPVAEHHELLDVVVVVELDEARLPLEHRLELLRQALADARQALRRRVELHHHARDEVRASDVRHFRGDDAALARTEGAAEEVVAQGAPQTEEDAHGGFERVVVDQVVAVVDLVEEGAEEVLEHEDDLGRVAGVGVVDGVEGQRRDGEVVEVLVGAVLDQLFAAQGCRRPADRLEQVAADEAGVGDVAHGLLVRDVAGAFDEEAREVAVQREGEVARVELVAGHPRGVHEGLERGLLVRRQHVVDEHVDQSVFERAVNEVFAVAVDAQKLFEEVFVALVEHLSGQREVGEQPGEVAAVLLEGGDLGGEVHVHVPLVLHVLEQPLDALLLHDQRVLLVLVQQQQRHRGAVQLALQVVADAAHRSLYLVARHEPDLASQSPLVLFHRVAVRDQVQRLAQEPGHRGRDALVEVLEAQRAFVQLRDLLVHECGVVEGEALAF